MPSSPLSLITKSLSSIASLPGVDLAKSSLLPLSSTSPSIAIFLFPLPQFYHRHHSANISTHRFSDEFPSIHFAKIDVDEVPDVAQELGIRAMPTFLIFKDGEKVQEVVGANPQALKAAIDKVAAA
jgi:thiol-disulfide isomerase/thioredoxin